MHLAVMLSLASLATHIVLPLPLTHPRPNLMACAPETMRATALCRNPVNPTHSSSALAQHSPVVGQLSLPVQSVVLYI